MGIITIYNQQKVIGHIQVYTQAVKRIRRQWPKTKLIGVAEFMSDALAQIVEKRLEKGESISERVF